MEWQLMDKYLPYTRMWVTLLCLVVNLVMLTVGFCLFFFIIHAN